MRTSKRAGDVYASASAIPIASFAAMVGLIAAMPTDRAFDITVSGLNVLATQNHTPTATQITSGQPGQEYYLLCGFTPSGSGGPSSVQFRFLVNGQVVRDVQAPVESGKFVAMGEFWTPPAAGTYTLICEANPNKTFAETTYANNKQTKQFSVTSLTLDASAAIKAEALIPSHRGKIAVDVAKDLAITPDIRVHGLEVHSVNPDNTLQPPTVVTKGVLGREYSLHCVMEPVGQVASGSVRFLFRVNGQIIRDVHAPVELGTPINMGAKWTPQTAGTYQLVCEANPNQTFAEATFANNLGEALFPVQLALSPEAVIEAGPALNPPGEGEKETDEKTLLLCPECFNPQPEPPGDPPPEGFHPDPPPPPEGALAPEGLQPKPPGDPPDRKHEHVYDHNQPTRFEQLRQQALAARSPGGDPAAESGALLERLTAQHASRVEAENTRILTLAKSISTGPLATDQGGDPGELVADADVPDLGLDPCGKPEAPLEVSAVQATPPLDPGEWVLVQGCGLGTSSGELRLMGDFPGGHSELQVENWAPTYVYAQLPLVTGVGDMPSARLQLVRQDGKFSELLDVGGFRATREVKRVHPTDVTVTCGQWGNDECTLAQSHPLSESQFYGGASFAAKHSNQVAPDCDGVFAKLGEGTDRTDLAIVNLANGWVLTGYAWWWNPLTGSGYVQQPAGFNMNASSANVAMNWGLGLNQCYGPQKSEVRYRVDLYAVGPKGLPYK